MQRTNMKDMLITFLLLPIVFPTIGSAQSGDEKIMIVVGVAGEQASPVRIIGLKLPERVGGEPVVVVRNKSGREVRYFIVEAMIGIPNRSGNPENGRVGAISSSQRQLAAEDAIILDRETGGQHKSATPSAYVEERALRPEGQADVHEWILQSFRLASDAERLRSACVYVVVSISQVEFDDGSTWSSPPDWDKKQHLWEISVRSLGLPSCVAPFNSSRQLGGLAGAGYITNRSPIQHPEVRLEFEKLTQSSLRIETSGDPAALKHYLVECPIRRFGGKGIAVCPI